LEAVEIPLNRIKKSKNARSLFAFLGADMREASTVALSILLEEQRRVPVAKI
jgi:hypothetical protein